MSIDQGNGMLAKARIKESQQRGSECETGMTTPQQPQDPPESHSRQPARHQPEHLPFQWIWTND